MMSPHKKIPPDHATCLLLSQDANTKLHALLEPKTQALCTAFVSVLISKPPKQPEWKTYRTGAAILIKDHTRKSYFVQIFDLVEWKKVREEVLAKGTTYQVSLPTFHQMETSKAQAMGMKFSYETEARIFAQIARTITMTGLYKREGNPMPTNIPKEYTRPELNKGTTSEEGKSGSDLGLPSPQSNMDLTQLRQKSSSQSRPPRPATMLMEPPPTPSQLTRNMNKEDFLNTPPPPLPLNKEARLTPPPPPPPVNRGTHLTTPPPTTPVSKDARLTPPPPPPPADKNCSMSVPSIPVNKDASFAFPMPPLTSDPGSKPTWMATIDRKRQKNKKITKDMIGEPTNFQHVYHVGFDSKSSPDDEKAMQAAVGERIKKPNLSRPPPPPPPGPPKNYGQHPSLQAAILDQSSIDEDQEHIYDYAIVDMPERSINPSTSEDLELPLHSAFYHEAEQPDFNPSEEPEQDYYVDMSANVFEAHPYVNDFPNSENLMDSEGNTSLEESYSLCTSDRMATLGLMEISNNNNITSSADKDTSVTASSLSEALTNISINTATNDDSDEDNNSTMLGDCKIESSLLEKQTGSLIEVVLSDETPNVPDTSMSDLSLEILSTLDELEAALNASSCVDDDSEFVHQTNPQANDQHESNDYDTESMISEVLADNEVFTESSSSLTSHILANSMPESLQQNDMLPNLPDQGNNVPAPSLKPITALDTNTPKAPTRQKRKNSQRPTPPPPPPPPSTPTDITISSQRPTPPPPPSTPTDITISSP